MSTEGSSSPPDRHSRPPLRTAGSSSSGLEDWREPSPKRLKLVERGKEPVMEEKMTKKVYVFFRTLNGDADRNRIHWYRVKCEGSVVRSRGSWILPFSTVDQPADSTVIGLGSLIYSIGGRETNIPRGFCMFPSKSVYFFDTTSMKNVDDLDEDISKEEEDTHGWYRCSNMINARVNPQVAVACGKNVDDLDEDISKEEEDTHGWYRGSNMINARVNPQVAVACGKIFVCGGFQTGDCNWDWDAWAEVYDPDTKIWSPLDKASDGSSIYCLLNPDGKQPFHFSMISELGSSSLTFSSESSTWCYNPLSRSFERRDKHLFVLSRKEVSRSVLIGGTQYLINFGPGVTLFGLDTDSGLVKNSLNSILPDFDFCCYDGEGLPEFLLSLLRTDQLSAPSDEDVGKILHLILHGVDNEIHLRSIGFHEKVDPFDNSIYLQTYVKSTASFSVPWSTIILDGLLME